jgi:D-cysteine desulfhydrase
MIDFSRLELATLPTPITALRRLTDEYSGGEILLKRDDLTGFSIAGNKARPLEYLLAEAQAQGYTCVVGGGAPKSNFIAALAHGARVAGLDCELLVAAPEDASDSVTVALARAAGANITMTAAPREDLDWLIVDRARARTAAGTPAMPIPRGGATPIGAIGFARAGLELADQIGTGPCTIVIPVGSGGSVAGLAVGAYLVQAQWTLVGVSVSRPLEQMAVDVDNLSVETARLLGASGVAPVELVDAHDHSWAEDRAAADLLMRSEGILLDPVYGVRALPEAIRRARSGERVVLWSTGGLPSALSLASSPVEANEVGRV